MNYEDILKLDDELTSWPVIPQMSLTAEELLKYNNLILSLGTVVAKDFF